MSTESMMICIGNRLIEISKPTWPYLLDTKTTNANISSKLQRLYLTPLMQKLEQLPVKITICPLKFLFQ